MLVWAHFVVQSCGMWAIEHLCVCVLNCKYPNRDTGGVWRQWAKSTLGKIRPAERDLALAILFCITSEPSPVNPVQPTSSLPPPDHCLPTPPSLLHPSLLVLAEDVVLFTLHVLKVEVTACHALVDVLDVVTCCFEMSGGIVGPWCKNLETWQW